MEPAQHKNRVERFTLKPHGASVSANREIVVQGDNQFRPIDVALAPDGSLYFTDWVDRSYNVHGKGRIWRLRWIQDPPEHVVPPLSDAERRARLAASMPDWDALRSDDPFLHHAAMMGLTNSPLLTIDRLAALQNGRQRLGLLQAARRSRLSSDQHHALIEKALQDSDSSVRLYAVRWIADEGLTEFRQPLEKLLHDNDMAVALFLGVLAAIEWLDTGRVEPNRIAGESALVAALKDGSRPRLQSMALKGLPAGHEAVTTELLSALVMNPQVDAVVRQEAARSLATSEAQDANEARLAVASRVDIPPEIRADALAGVTSGADETRMALEQLAASESILVRKEAARVLSRSTNTKAESVGARPDPSDTSAWLNILDGPGNADAGWRVFFGRSAARCANCHRLDGRGADVGPDLTSIGLRMDRRRLLQSILQPSQEIGPRYVPWTVETEPATYSSACRWAS